MGRRKDGQLRKAIDRIRQQLHSNKSVASLHSEIIIEVLQITRSTFGFLITRESTSSETQYSISACEQSLEGEHNRFGKVTQPSPSNSQSMGLALNIAFARQSPHIYSQYELDRLPLAEHWPALDQMIVIPLTNQQTTYAALCIANCLEPYEYDLVKRMWPFLATCNRVLNTHDRATTATPNKDSLAPLENALARSASDTRNELQQLEAHTIEGIVELNQNLMICDLNPAAEKMFGIARHMAIGQEIVNFLPERFPNEHRIRTFGGASNTRAGTKLESFHAKRANNELFLVDLVSYSRPKNRQNYYVLLVLDKSDVHQIQQLQEEETQRFKAVADMAPIGILQTNSAWECTYVNDRWCDICAMSQEDALDLGWINALHIDEVSEVLAELRAALRAGKEFNKECRLQTPLGEIIWAEVHVRPLIGEKGDLEGFLATLSDVTYHHFAEQQLRNMAELDSLTGLANRALFQQRLEHGLERVGRLGALVLFSLDLDGFKIINDTLGHDVGDALLVDVANRLRTCVRAEDTIARLGGDEFGVIMENVNNAIHASDIAEKILTSLAQPFDVNRQEVFVTGSIGITFATDGDTSNLSALYKQADIALYRAKAAGRNNFQYYSPEMEHESKERLYLGNSLHRALDRREFDVYYQLQANTDGSAIVGSEALLRWRHPERGLLPPDSFIPLLEDTGLINSVAHWMFQQAFCDHQLLIKKGLMASSSHISVNLAPRQLRESRIIESINNALQESNLPAKNVVLEITESVLLEDSPIVSDNLHQLKQLGIKISLDDFGTGYSSLTYLKRFPIDYLKIDQNFIRDILTDAEDETITKAVIALASSLNLTCVAEGVDTKEKLAVLRDWGCKTYQGYCLNKPAPIKQLEAKLIEEMGDNVVCIMPGIPKSPKAGA